MANKVLTVYISSDAIRVAEMQKSNKTVILGNAAEVPTPKDSFNDGYITDVSSISEAIRQAIFGRGFTAKEVVFTVSSKKIASKEIEVNYFKNTKKLAQVLQANSSEYFPMSASGEYAFAYSILEDYYSEGDRKYRVSAVAAPMDLIRGYYEIAEDLKLSVDTIDYFGNSVIQLLSLQMTPGRTDLVLQIENDATYVNVMRGPVLVLQRSVQYGKNAVINALMNVKKISEKDARTLLSKEKLVEEHVTADEYADAVSYLVNGIGRAVEYHRTKNPDEEIQGIKIFGEGSAIAGIEKILERELGAKVEHFETLAGVSIKGQAALKAEEVLRYLPNIGSVIDPMDLTINNGKKQSFFASSDLTKYMLIALGISVVTSGAFSLVTYLQHKEAVEEGERIQAQIDQIKDIEEIKVQYDQAQLEYDAIKEFDNNTHNDNEYALRFINDLERLLPKGTVMDSISFINGDVTFSVVSDWHEITKNEVADVIVSLQGLDYVRNFNIPSFDETAQNRILVGYDKEDQPVFLRDFTIETDPETDEMYVVWGDYVEWSSDIQLSKDDMQYYDIERFLTPEDFGVEVDEDAEEEADEETVYYTIYGMLQTTYSISLHIAAPVVEEAEGGAQ